MRIEGLLNELYEEIASTARNKASMDGRELAVIRKCFDVGILLAGAIVSISESQQHIARGTERPWKPGDDVVK